MNKTIRIIIVFAAFACIGVLNYKFIPQIKKYNNVDMLKPDRTQIIKEYSNLNLRTFIILSNIGIVLAAIFADYLVMSRRF